MAVETHAGSFFRLSAFPATRQLHVSPTMLLLSISLGALWRPPFQSAHLCPPAIFSGLEWYTTFRGPNPGPEWNSCSHLFGARMVYLFGARIRDPNGTAFRGPKIERLFGPQPRAPGHEKLFDFGPRKAVPFGSRTRAPKSCLGPRKAVPFGSRIRAPKSCSIWAPGSGSKLFSSWKNSPCWLRRAEPSRRLVGRSRVQIPPAPIFCAE